MLSPNLNSVRAQIHQSQFSEALATIQQIIRQDPMNAEAWELAAYLLVSRKKWSEARQLLTTAIEVFPTRATLRAYYAMALDKTGDLDAAYTQIARALEQAPDSPTALLTRIEILSDAGHYNLALQDSLRLPDDELPETASFCQGSLSFLTGDLTGGMRQMSPALKSGWRGRDLPEWTGDPAPGKHIILYNGQAFGDLIQFARYINPARANASKITLQVPRAMERLMRDSFPTLSLLPDNADAPPDASMRCALTSLAAQTTFDPRPQPTPYLRTNPTLVKEWRARLANIPRPHIGLVWTSPWQMNNPFRTVDFPTLAPLLKVARQHLISLQMGPESQQAATAGLFDASPHIKDFADTAALMHNLDLVISLDSAPAHLAGALGKPVWTFLPFNGEWRWLIAREDCIWYPTMRLFRQTAPQGWSDLFQKMALDLRLLLAGNTNILRPLRWSGPTPKTHPHAHPLPNLKSAAA